MAQYRKIEYPSRNYHPPVYMPEFAPPVPVFEEDTSGINKSINEQKTLIENQGTDKNTNLLESVAENQDAAKSINVFEAVSDFRKHPDKPFSFRIFNVPFLIDDIILLGLILLLFLNDGAIDEILIAVLIFLFFAGKEIFD